MMRDAFDNEPCLLTTRNLATRWGKSVRTLQRWRALGYGPAWFNAGRSTFYRIEDVLRFERREQIGVEVDQ
ncbi:MAG: helix-turn-helix domain-containing protein [Pseudomonadota bacterium]